MDSNRPKLSVVLAAVAGGFVVIDGAVLWSEGSFLNLIHPGLGNFSLFYGQTEALAGFALIGLAFVLGLFPRYHLFTGLAIVAIALLSVFGGGGFFVGVPLGVVGGVLGMLFRVEYYPSPQEYTPEEEPSLPAAAPPSQTARP